MIQPKRAHHISTRQRKLMIMIVKGNPDGSYLDLFQVLAKLDPAPTKQAIQCSLKIMEDKG